MDATTRDVIERCAAASHAGEQHFGRAIATLSGVGVESYFADYRAGTTTYYLPDGRHLAVAAPQPDVAIATAFDTGAIRAAILGAQRDEVRYPEFVRRTRAAGCVGYFVWLAGRHVAYHGRRGESHVERFPD